MNRVVFITSCPLVWGGSEELWSGAASELQKRGTRVFAGRSAPWPSWKKHHRWTQLREAGVELRDFGASNLSHLLADLVERISPAAVRPVWRIRNLALAAKLSLAKPDLVVIAQGGGFDGLFPVFLPEICRFAGVPYVIISQKFSEIDWPYDGLREIYKRSFLEASASFFVSKHNQRTVEMQLGIRLPASELVRNPFMVRADGPITWPDFSDGLLRLACVARLFPLDKGQDLILKVLAKEKWRNRPIEVDFFGEGPMARGLEEMAKSLGLANVRFPGFCDTTEIWRMHHALVLPSRAEGLPLAQVEAMMCGRPVIVADAGGAGEIMEDGVHGFLASGASETEIDCAMERAWQCRERWPSIGAAAAAHIRTIYPENPCAVFADRLEKICASL